MSTPPNNIRVFVEWTEPTVFAGEDIECQITFKNIAKNPGPSKNTLQPSAAGGFNDRQRKPTANQEKGNSSQSARLSLANKGHRTTLSLNVPVGSALQQSTRGPASEVPTKTATERPPHKRSVSIISIGTTENGTDGNGSLGNGDRPRRASKGHGRSASLQIVPRKQAINGTSSTAPTNQRSSTQPSPLISSFSPTGVISPQSDRASRHQAGIITAPSTPNIPTGTFARKKGPTPLPHPFRFPTVSSASPDTRSQTDSIPDGLLSPSLKSNTPPNGDHVAPTARVLSPSSIAGTPRSSGEFYSVSNNSNETLASEYQSQQNIRGLVSTGHMRRSSNLPTANYYKPPETLMMGYAQIHGSFILDPSLIDQAPFEEIKRKGAIGGQGGGVIGVETNKRDSGLLRSFRWGNIGDSLGGLLSGSELSSMKDMRGIASSRSVPLLSTPQSILFVDLRLGPGESKSYKYGFKLPRGLPPSHRGKAIKISYKLVIGIQRPGGAKEQQVKSVEVPFRILGSVNSHGELLGHDLMSPYIILQDQARVRALPESLSDSLAGLSLQTSSKRSDSTQNQFLEYVEQLLTKARQGSSASLLSPSEMPRSRRQSHMEEPVTAREAIDMAILRSNVATESHQSANRFEIARSGKRVAVVMLARPSYRLGETVNITIDFTDAEIPCYAIHASLESSERVQPSISLRSEASILRVTRKTYASHSESTLFARRIVFSPAIPISATPEFITSGVSLDWRVRVEFVTPRLVVESEEGNVYPELLEELAKDERGIVLAAAEALNCESFEIAVPLRVYGALAPNAEQNDVSVDGLAV